MTSIQDHRQFYANFLVRSSGSSDQRLIAAFAEVERERYVGAGPWPVFIGTGYVSTVSADPRLLYQDILIGLATDRGINNGQPSLHARCLVACAPSEGESVVHIGAGTGYYSAVLAHLVGARGNVTGYEIEADLAARASRNLAHLRNVSVIQASASEAALPNADVIYVCAGATHPLPCWLDALNLGGRLIFPLTPNEGFGCMLLVTRCGPAIYTASAICRAAFIPCIGARDDVTSAALTMAFNTQAATAVRSLHRDASPDDTAWCIGDGWWLSTTQVGE